MKSSAYYLHMTTKILADFQICISVPLKYLYVLSKNYLICIPREHTPFWQLSRLDDFSINPTANLFFHEKLKIPKEYSELSRAFKIEFFANLVYG